MQNNVNQSFSKRYGHAPAIPEITIREDAPEGLRYFVLQYARSGQIGTKKLREIVCKVLKEVPDDGNWSDENILQECKSLIENCEWYKVYDVIEAICQYLDYVGQTWPHDTKPYHQYVLSLNTYMEEKGIGWKIEEGKIVARAPEAIESTVTHAVAHLEAAQKFTAKSELHKAYEDLSKRPVPDITGAIQHALASLECVAKDVSNKPNLTLGEIVRTHPEFFPNALRKVADGIWGYASQNGRHITEGQEPEMKDAFLMVGLSASLMSYLLSDKG